jgi:hypothetical protein
MRRACGAAVAPATEADALRARARNADEQASAIFPMLPPPPPPPPCWRCRHAARLRRATPRRATHIREKVRASAAAILLKLLLICCCYHDGCQAPLLFYTFSNEMPRDTRLPSRRTASAVADITMLARAASDAAAVVYCLPARLLIFSSSSSFLHDFVLPPF